MSPGICLVTPLAQARFSAKSGRKASDLSKLIAAGFDVPPGFVISSDVYRWHLRTSREPPASASIIEEEDREAIRAAVLGHEVADDVWSAIVEAYRELGFRCRVDEPDVAVRASPLQDIPGAYESYLNVKGLDELEASVRRVWASVWSRGAAGFRAGPRPDDEPAMAVVVQRMVKRTFWGSVTTADPITGNPNRVQVSCESDSGETYDLEANLGELRVPFGCWRPGDFVPELAAERAVLIEEVFGSRVDLEWAHDGERLWILQVRRLVDLPCYFPLDGPAEGDGGIEWRRATCLPVAPFSRSLLWDTERGQPKAFSAGRGDELRRLINGYAYRHSAGIDGKDRNNSAVRAQAREVAEGLRTINTRRQELPRLASGSAEVRGCDPSSMDWDALLSAVRAASDLWRRSVDMLEGSRHPAARFSKLLGDFLGNGTDAQALCRRLVSGVAESTVMRDARLQDLGDQLATARQTGKLDDRKWWSAFRGDVEALAREHGYAFADAGEAYDVASWRSWVEDPEPLFRTIGALARRGKRTSLVTLHSAGQASARQAEEEAGAMYKGSARTRFRSLLALSRGWMVLRCDAQSMCALAGTALRLALLELGRRLVESGTLFSAEDVFRLRTEDILSLPAEPTEAQRAKLKADIASANHELWLQCRLVAPERLPREGGREEFAGGPVRGESVSGGVATGRALVARTVAKAGEIENGEILIVRSPSPAWTPFLGIAGAFVAEEDDGLSIAPIALDYGIPVLVGCAGIMKAFRSGARITVDGSEGIVESARPAGATPAEHAAASDAHVPWPAFLRKTGKSAGL